MKRLLRWDPKYTQTGPAKRNDQQTLDKHLSMLESHDLKKLYLNLTTSIQKEMSKTAIKYYSTLSLLLFLTLMG